MTKCVLIAVNSPMQDLIPAPAGLVIVTNVSQCTQSQGYQENDSSGKKETDLFLGHFDFFFDLDFDFAAAFFFAAIQLRRSCVIKYDRVGVFYKKGQNKISDPDFPKITNRDLNRSAGYF